MPWSDKVRYLTSLRSLNRLLSYIECASPPQGLTTPYINHHTNQRILSAAEISLNILFHSLPFARKPGISGS